MQIQTTMIQHFTPVRTALTRKKKTATKEVRSEGKNMKKTKPLGTIVRNAI